MVCDDQMSANNQICVVVMIKVIISMFQQLMHVKYPHVMKILVLVDKMASTTHVSAMMGTLCFHTMEQNHNLYIQKTLANHVMTPYTSITPVSVSIFGAPLFVPVFEVCFSYCY